MHNNINLQIDEGATVLMSNNPADYTVTKNRYEDEIKANDCHDIAITGQGVIDVARDPIQPVNETTPIWRHIIIENVTATGAKTCGMIYGVPEMPVSDIQLKNVRISGNKELDIIHARNIKLDHCEFTAEKGMPINQQDAVIIKQ